MKEAVKGDSLEVDLYVMDQYQGKCKVGKDSICGALLSGDINTGLAGIRDVVEEINNIPSVQATCGAGDCGFDLDKNAKYGTMRLKGLILL
jgi:hypothetical protein